MAVLIETKTKSHKVEFILNTLYGLDPGKPVASSNTRQINPLLKHISGLDRSFSLGLLTY